MPKRKSNSRALRELAEALIATLAEIYDIPDSEQEELITSLVRQWITYDGNATLFLGEDIQYFVLGRTPLGKPCLANPERPLPAGMAQYARDWKIPLEELPEILRQLNRGQAAEVTNEEDLPVRLWVNPRERSRGVEPLVKRPQQAGQKRDYHKFAAHELEKILDEYVDEDEREALTQSVVRQWREHEGHASLFLDEGKHYSIRFTELDTGYCQVVATSGTSTLEAYLRELGFSPDHVPEVVAAINLGQEVEFRAGDGILRRLRHDPRTLRTHVTPLDALRTMARSIAPPIFCPQCNAVLRPWREGEARQQCPQCGHAVAIY